MVTNPLHCTTVLIPAIKEVKTLSTRLSNHVPFPQSIRKHSQNNSGLSAGRTTSTPEHSISLPSRFSLFLPTRRPCSEHHTSFSTHCHTDTQNHHYPLSQSATHTHTRSHFLARRFTMNVCLHALCSAQVHAQTYALMNMGVKKS